MASRRTKSRRRPAAPLPQVGLTRVRIVWVSFLAAMTLAGGLLVLIDKDPSPRADGVSLSPLASATLIGSGSSDPLTQTRVPLDQSRWQAIVIHHSGSTHGDPASIEKEHRDHGYVGLGHHFIIGNGNGMDDGQVHIGYRWLDQKPGAHCTGPNEKFYNEHAISICLVGDGNRHGFTQAQIQQLNTLVESLRKQLGLPADRVLLHSDLAPVSDPGKLFPAGLYGLPAGHPEH
jgi:N-acetyl-anhydromuramyl-L-alanine amidase AmpD